MESTSTPEQKTKGNKLLLITICIFGLWTSIRKPVQFPNSSTLFLSLLLVTRHFYFLLPRNTRVRLRSFVSANNRRTCNRSSRRLDTRTSWGVRAASLRSSLWRAFRSLPVGKGIFNNGGFTFVDHSTCFDLPKLRALEGQIIYSVYSCFPKETGYEYSHKAVTNSVLWEMIT